MAQKKKHAGLPRRALIIIDALLIAAFLVSSIILIKGIIDRRRSRTLYEAAAQMAVGTPVPETPAPEIEAEAVSEAAQETAPVRRTAPEVPITVDFEQLATESRHVLGWLYSAGTPINYPLVQRDDNEYYLTHTYDGRKRSGGSIFFDCRNAADLSDANLILYGHHMADKSMFGSLLNYAYADDYYGNHPVMYLITPMQDYRIEIFAARTMNANAENYPVSFASEEEHRIFINRAINNSVIAADTDVADKAQTIMLVTCTYTGAMNDARFIIYGELVPLGV